MNTESFGYAVLTAIVGMGIVFGFLIVLSLLMVVIRTVFGREPDSSTSSSGRTHGSPGAAGGAAAAASGRAGGDSVTAGGAGDTHPADEIVGGVPRWVVAATLVYLSEEEREYAPRAGEWAIRSTR